MLRWSSYSYLTSETFNFTRKPANPTIVVEQVNSSQVELVWKYSLKSTQRLRDVIFYMQRPGESKKTRIARRAGDSKTFSFVSSKFKAHYKPKHPSTLVLLDVSNREESKYFCRISYHEGSRIGYPRSGVSVVVFGKYKRGKVLFSQVLLSGMQMDLGNYSAVQN